MTDTAQKAIADAARKAQSCEIKRVGVESELRQGFNAARPDLKEDFFKSAVRGLDLNLQDYTKLAFNYEAADKVSAPSINVDARIARVGKFIQDSCMGK